MALTNVGLTKKYTIGPLLGSGGRPNNEPLMTGCNDGLIVSYNHSRGDIKEYKWLSDFPGLRFLKQRILYSESLVSVKRPVDLA